MFKFIPHSFLAGILSIVVAGCNPSSTSITCPPKSDLAINQNPSITEIARKNPYLNRTLAKELSTSAYGEYDSYFTRQPPTQLTAQSDLGVKEISSSDNIWIFSPDCQKAIAVNGTTREPDASVDIYNRQNNQHLERLDFCGPSCSPIGVYWIDNSHFAAVRTTENFNSAPTQTTGQVLVVDYYDLSNGTITPYRSNKLLPER